MQCSKSFSCLFIFAAIFFTAAAQEPDSTGFLQEQMLQPVEIRAIRTGTHSPFVSTQLSKQQIEKLNTGQDLPYLLQYTPSVVVTSDAGAGIGYTGIRIRGTDGTRINVTLNGIPVNDAESQGTFFVNFGDLASSVSSIQVQRGVGTSTNGAGAFGATMSISNLAQSDEAGADLNVTAGSFNTRKYTLRAATGLLQGGWQFDLRLSKIASDGFIDRSASDLRALQFTAGWKASERTSFRWMMMTGKERTGQAWNGVPEEKLRGNDSALLSHYYNNLGQTYFTAQDSINLFQSDSRKYNGFTYPGQTDNYQQDYYQLFADHQFSSRWTGNVAFFLTRGRGYYEEYKHQQKFSKYGLEPFITPSGDTLLKTDLIRQLWLDNYFYGAVFSLLYQYRNTKLTLGGSYTSYDGEHYGFVKWAQYGVAPDYRWYLLDAHKTDLNLYAKAQQEWGKLTLFADVQLRHVNYRINGFRDNPDLKPSAAYVFLNPRAGVSYLLRNTNSQRQRIYASFAVAGKEPNRDDFEAAGNELPKAERLYDFEGGYEVQAMRWHVSANAYFMKYQDQLVLTGRINDVGAYTRTNVPESYRAGVELTAGAKLASWVSLEANATFSENKILNFTEYMDDYDAERQQVIHHGNTRIAFSPGEIASAVVSLTPFQHLPSGQQLTVDLLNKYTGKQYLDNTNNESRSLKAYSVTDVRLRYVVRVRPFKEVTASVALNNVFNKQYESNGYTFSYVYGGAVTTQNYYFPQAGFNWLFGLGFRW